ncbi:hypothetical protein EZY14_019585 [Kordia sp. TARA_039_SRF]|nr:hypothetical protein EZY14_019585 [Kordia sp. TARA_039_SRF]|tara:strand:+ start:3229 stop:4218 length:990 start_codon:yes stop_codon:yes gene_type:complete
MKRTSFSLLTLLSVTVFSGHAQAGISDMLNDYFTFRHDQKPLVAPERTLPPKHIVTPNYDERAGESWANYYTRPDLHAVEHMDSSSRVMRKDPNWRPPTPQQGYNNRQGYGGQGSYNGPIDPAMGYAGIQRRAQLNALDKYDGNVYIGEPGNNPFNLDNTGKAGQKTQIGKPKRNWATAPSDKVQPRIGDYDYVQRHKTTSGNNAFGSYQTTLAEEKPVEVTRSPGYFERDEVPLPSQNESYYETTLPNQYTVQPQDSLSGISGQNQIYGDWKKWPLIYDQNRSQIQDPDLIHPGQNLDIPRGYNQAQESDARRRAEEKKAPYSFYDGR